MFHIFGICFLFVKLQPNLQTKLNFSWLEQELTLFSRGRRKKPSRSVGCVKIF